MPSSFLWIDDSDTQRKRIEDALETFTERGTRDELGLAVIRDAFSDLLFPGTGSLQTRAAYFLFVPWMYRDMERDKVRSAEAERVAKRREIELIGTLLASDDTDGTIGKRSQASLIRRPSSIYWHGLGRLGIRRFQGSQEAYHRSLDTWYRRNSTALRSDDGEAQDAPAGNWHAVPEPPATWPSEARFHLRVADALYLRERIRATAADTLLAQFDGRVAPDEKVSFAWDHPVAGELASREDHLSREFTRQLRHARCFSEALYGAAILYNLLVAEQIPGGTDLVEKYREQLTAWHGEIQAARDRLASWDLADLWRLLSAAHARVHPFAKDFVERWVALVRTTDLRASTTGELARRLVTLREKQLKGALARIGNRQASDRWLGDSGLYRMDFRWGNAHRILSDIATGANGGPRARP
jgi:hypothetical protein